MKLRPLPIRSLLLAPLASIPVTTLSALGTSDAGMASDFGWGLFFSVLIVAPVSYMGMFAIGLPLFFLLREFKWLLLLSACAAGVIASHAILGGTSFFEIAKSLAPGLAVSLAAYFLRPSTPTNKFPLGRDFIP